MKIIKPLGVLEHLKLGRGYEVGSYFNKAFK